MVTLDFHSTEKSKVKTALRTFSNQSNEIFIEIEDTSVDHEYGFQFVCLDKETAIKLAKEIRKQISFLED